MFKSYIKVALRRLSREKLYVFMNILSLALGIASFLILALYLRSELTYDRHHVNHERIYRITAHFTQADQQQKHFAMSQIGLAPMLVQDYPQLGTYVRFFPSPPGEIRYEDNRQVWEDTFLADPAVFKVFTHQILYGDPEHAFDDPTSVAISAKMAQFYFGNDNPIGKSLITSSGPTKVTLVFADLPENTHLRYDALFPIDLLKRFNPNFSQGYQNTLWNVGNFSYLMVTPQFRPEEFAALSTRFYENHMKEMGARLKNSFHAELQPLTEQHFGAKLDGDRLAGNIFYVYGFGAVAIFILAIGCINYVNLATARAARQAKEVGMRKVLGASQPQLVGQFLGESLTFTAIALVTALLCMWLALAVTPLGTLMGKVHLLSALREPPVWIGIIALAVFVAVAAGLYPALYLSSITPLAALTETRRSWRTGFSLRQILVFVQLAISIGVIASTMLMASQIRYVHERPLGFDKENRLIVTLRGFDQLKNLQTLKSELRNTQGVLDVSVVDQPPGTGNMVNLVGIESQSGTMEPTGVDRINAGLNVVDALKLTVVEGRGFSEEIPTDVMQSVLVNESFVKKLGWTNALGKRVQAGPSNAQVIGVVRDFHYSSLHNAIGPLLIQPLNEDFARVPPMARNLVRANVIVVLSGNDIRGTLDRVRTVFLKLDPKFMFEPLFLEDRLNDLYASETNLMRLIGTFAFLCIFICLIGLFGLTAFTVEQRTKELGIRQVLGASDFDVVSLLSRHLLVLVAVAAIPASIVSYQAFGKWTQRFAYHVDASLSTFVVATVLVAAVTLATVAFQSFKMGLAKPIEALKRQ